MIVGISPKIPDILIIIVLYPVLFPLEHNSTVVINSNTQKAWVSSLPQSPPLPIVIPSPDHSFMLLALSLWVSEFATPGIELPPHSL